MTSHTMPTTQERLEAARAALHAPFRYELQRHEYDRYLRTFLIGLLGDVKQDVLEPSKCFMDPNQLCAIYCAPIGFFTPFWSHPGVLGQWPNGCHSASCCRARGEHRCSGCRWSDWANAARLFHTGDMAGGEHAISACPSFGMSGPPLRLPGACMHGSISGSSLERVLLGAHRRHCSPHAPSSRSPS